MTSSFPRLTTVATRADVDDPAVLQVFGEGALNAGHTYPGRDSFAVTYPAIEHIGRAEHTVLWDPLSMEGPHRSTWHLTGYRLVGQTDTRAVYVFRCAVNGTSSTKFCAAVVDVSREEARIVTVHAYDYQPSSETTRAGAEEKAAEVLAELAAPSPELAAELAADARAAWDRGTVAAPALSAVVMRELTAMAAKVGDARTIALMTTWTTAYEAARDASCGECRKPANEVTDHVVDGIVYHAACIPEEHDPETDGGHFLADPAGGGTWQPGAEPSNADLWVESPAAVEALAALHAAGARA